MEGRRGWMSGWKGGREKHENTTQRSTKYFRSDLQSWSDTCPPTDTQKNTPSSEVGGDRGIVLPVARGGLTPTPCRSNLVIGCLLLWQQSSATASVKRITESSVTGPGMTPPNTHTHWHTLNELYWQQSPHYVAAIIKLKEEKVNQRTNIKI